MNTTRHHRLTPLAALLLLAACRSSGGASDVDPVIAEPVESQPAVAVEAPPSDPVAPGEAVDDEFTRLLASLGVTYAAKEQCVEITGWVNMQSGLVEVFACAPQGKTHEAVVVLDCVPSGLHAGLLALGCNPGTPVEFGTGDEYRPPTGDGVDIEVRWTDASGVERSARAEDWIWDETRRAPMPRAAWIFAGSFLQPVEGGASDATYAADYIKSLATTYHDASSILENPHVEGIDDTVYYAHKDAVPAVGTPIVARFRRAR